MMPFRTQVLENGYRLDFTDRSNRYFGDYHRILIEVRIECLLPQDGPPGEAFWQQARTAFGERLILVRTLERMGVATADAAQVRDQLVDDFLANAGRYLQHPGYLQALIDAELKKRRPGRIYAP